MGRSASTGFFAGSDPRAVCALGFPAAAFAYTPRAAMHRSSKTVLALALAAACAGGGFFAVKKYRDHDRAPSEVRAWRTRQLAGLTLEAPGDFQNTPLDLGVAQEFIESSEMQIAKAAGFEIDVLRTVYKTGVELNFDAAAKGAVEGFAHDGGVRNVQHTATETTVSGKAARRLSITAERWRKALRVEAILIADGQAYYQVQAIFDPGRAHAQEDAERLLKSVQLAP